jgi:cell division topological specificity factor MinE
MSRLPFNINFKSAKTAKNRLNVMLLSDKSDLTLKSFEQFKQELICIISNYFTIEEKQIKIKFLSKENTINIIIPLNEDKIDNMQKR